jgi:hypothetical protein
MDDGWMDGKNGSGAVVGGQGWCRGRERAYTQNDCVYSILYVHTCLMREIPTLRRRSGSRPPGQQPPPPSMLPATLPYIAPPRPSVNAAVGQSWQRPGRVVGGER